MQEAHFQIYFPGNLCIIERISQALQAFPLSSHRFEKLCLHLLKSQQELVEFPRITQPNSFLFYFRFYLSTKCFHLMSYFSPDIYAFYHKNCIIAKLFLFKRVNLCKFIVFFEYICIKFVFVLILSQKMNMQRCYIKIQGEFLVQNVTEKMPKEAL